jgi:hypothetical protein
MSLTLFYEVAPSRPRFPLPVGPLPPSPPLPPPWGPLPPSPPSPPLPVALSPPLPPSPPRPEALSPPSPPRPVWSMAACRTVPPKPSLPALSIGRAANTKRETRADVVFKRIGFAPLVIHSPMTSPIAAVPAVPPMGAAVAARPARASASTVGAVASVSSIAPLPSRMATRPTRGSVTSKRDDRGCKHDECCNDHCFFNRHRYLHRVLSRKREKIRLGFKLAVITSSDGPPARRSRSCFSFIHKPNNIILLDVEWRRDPTDSSHVHHLSSGHEQKGQNENVNIFHPL